MKFLNRFCFAIIFSCLCAQATFAMESSNNDLQVRIAAFEKNPDQTKVLDLLDEILMQQDQEMYNRSAGNLICYLGVDEICSEQGEQFLAKLENGANDVMREKVRDRITVLRVENDCYEPGSKDKTIRSNFQVLRRKSNLGESLFEQPSPVKTELEQDNKQLPETESTEPQEQFPEALKTSSNVDIAASTGSANIERQEMPGSTTPTKPAMSGAKSAKPQISVMPTLFKLGIVTAVLTGLVYYLSYSKPLFRNHKVVIN